MCAAEAVGVPEAGGAGVAVVVIGSAGSRACLNNYRPTIWGKISTFWQIVAAVAAIASATSGVTRDIIYLSAVATLWSAVHYTYRGIAFFVEKGGDRIDGRR